MSDTPKKKLIRALPEVAEPYHIFSILEKEVKNFVELSKQYKGETAASKMFRKTKGVFKKSVTLSEGDICGTYIAKVFPSEKIRASVKKLDDDPLDSNARKTLIEPFTLRGVKGDLLTFRQVVFHAMFEMSAHQIDTEKVNLAILAQHNYLTKLADFFKEEAAYYQMALNELDERSSKKKTNVKATKGQKHSREELAKELKDFKAKYQFIKEVILILKSKPIKTPLTVDMLELRSSGQIPKEIAQKVIPSLLGGMVAMPIIAANTQTLVEIAKSGAPRVPAGGYYESRMHRNISKVYFAGYAAGWQQLSTDCQKSIIAAFNAINNTLKVVGNNPTSSLEKACAREFGIVCIIIAQQFPMLGASPPANLKQAMKKAVSLLESISNEAGVAETISVLQRNIAG